MCLSQSPTLLGSNSKLGDLESHLSTQINGTAKFNSASVNGKNLPVDCIHRGFRMVGLFH